MRKLLTIAEAAEVMGVSRRHIMRLIEEADVSKKSRWRWGRELVELTPTSSSKRTIRINLSDVVLRAQSQTAFSGSLHLLCIASLRA